MQYPLLLVAAFATASIAAPAAGPPASTQGKEDVAKEAGKLAEEACPPIHSVHIDGLGYSLAQDDCKLLADECLQGGFTEPAELKKCITDAYIYGIKAENLVKEACPRDQLVEDCKRYADKCLQGGIIEPAKLKECITDARIKSKKPARCPKEPAKEA
ncbi:hypothetical protein VB005_05630 [Metarhizium brunneum]